MHDLPAARQPWPGPTADELIRAVLRADARCWPADLDPDRALQFQAQADFHGVAALLYRRLATSGWPATVVLSLRNQALHQAMWELRHQQVLAQVLAALNAIGIEPILFKGTALAYSLYPDPALRTRGDTDLIIPLEAKAQVEEALASLGYQRSAGVSGEFVSYQANFVLRTADGGSHVLDLHWKINNSQLLSQLFSYDELRKDAAPLPKLCPHALQAGPVHALLLACMHRSTHKHNPYYVHGQPHYSADRLIWLYDIDLLAAQLTAAQWQEVDRQAGAKGLRAVCLDGLQRATECLGTRQPEAASSLQRPDTVKATGRYLASGKTAQQWMDFWALGSWSRQLAWVGELLFPPAAYMHGKYRQSRRVWLPWLYFRRAAGGLAKRLAGPRR